MVTVQTDTLPVVSFLPNQMIFSPLIIEISSQGNWLAHEGQPGTVTLYADNRDELATAIMKSKDGNWMTTEPADFIAELQFDQGQFLQGTLVFRNNVVTTEGDGKDPSLSLPVSFMPADSSRRLERSICKEQSFLPTAHLP